MVKLLSSVALILAIIFFPPAALALVSQNAIPGDSTYPIKRKLEDVILAAASINPTTKAWFSVNRADRRFEETQALLAAGKNADPSLDELVSQTSLAATEITQVNDDSKKQQLQSDLNQNVGKFIQTLAVVESKNNSSGGIGVSDQVALPTSNPTAQPSLSPIPLVSITPSPSSRPSLPPTPIPVQTPKPQPTPVPTDPKEICKSLPDDKSSLGKTLKELCGIQERTENPRPNSANSTQPVREQRTPEPSRAPQQSGGSERH